MWIELKPEMTFDAIAGALQQNLPQYEVTLKKNPLAGFQYVQVKKSGAVGVWVRVFPKKNKVALYRCFPSALVRALFGGLLLIAFTYSAQGKVQQETADVLKKTFGTN